MSDILVIDHVTIRFGGRVANEDISFTVREGEIIGLIGPNGAGKSTLFNCIACYYNANEGKILYRNRNISRETPETVCRMGISRSFQIVAWWAERCPKGCSTRDCVCPAAPL